MKFKIRTAENPKENVTLKYPQIMGRFVTSKKGDITYIELNTPQDFTRLAKDLKKDVIISEKGDEITIFDGWL